MKISYKFWEILKGVEHVKAMIVDCGSGHCVMAQVQSLAELHDESAKRFSSSHHCLKLDN